MNRERHILVVGEPGFTRNALWTLCLAGLGEALKHGTYASLQERLESLTAPPRAIVLEARGGDLQPMRMLTALRLNAALKSVPVILVSTDDETGFIPKGLEMGPFRVLRRPLMAEALRLAADELSLKRSEATAPCVLDCDPFVVDDDPDFILLMKRLLMKLGVVPERIRTCPDGDVAIKVLSSEPWTPSLVLLDHNLPKRTGLDVLEWIRFRSTRKDLPVVILSTGSEPELVQAAYQLGADAYFEKPLGMAELRLSLEAILSYWNEGNRYVPIPGSIRPHGGGI